MKYVGYWSILFVGLLVQTTGSSGLVIFGYKLEVLLLLTLLFAIIHGPYGGAILGFVGGLMQDLLVGHYIGLYASVLMFVCLGVGYLSKRLYKENFLVRFMAIFAGTAQAKICFLVGKIAFGATVYFGRVTFMTILGSALLNAFVGLLIFRPLVLLDKRLIYWDEVFKRTG